VYVHCLRRSSSKCLCWVRRKTLLTCSLFDLLFVCVRCGGNFCGVHRCAETHGCSFDYKSEGRLMIEQNNPLITAEKLPRIWDFYCVLSFASWLLIHELCIVYHQSYNLCLVLLLQGCSQILICSFGNISLSHFSRNLSSTWLLRSADHV